MFNLVNDGVQRTKSKPGTIIKELSRKTGVKESVLYSRYRNLNTGRRPSSREKAQTDIPEGGHNPIPHDQVPPPLGEEKLTPPLGSPASILAEIDSQVQASRDGEPECFLRYGSGNDCDACKYNLPCKMNSAGMPKIDTSTIDPNNMSQEELAALIMEALDDLPVNGDGGGKLIDQPVKPKSDREILQSWERPLEWKRIMTMLRDVVMNPDSRLRNNGMTPKVAAFDLAVFAKEISDAGFKSALEGDD